MTRPARHLAYLLLALALVLNGWGASAHALAMHVAGEDAPAVVAAEGPGDCPSHASHSAPAVDPAHGLPGDCCDQGRCDGCPCGLGFSPTSLPAGLAVSGIAPTVYLLPWRTDGFAGPPPARTLRPPIA